MTDPTDVDPTAPVVAEHRITIAAPVEIVWAVHVDVDSWSEWSPDIDRATTPAPLAPGVTFEWESFGLSVASTVYRLDEPHRILWGGDASGITGIHAWTFSPADAGTEVVTRESWSGDPIEADVPTAKGQLDQSLDSWLAALKTEAERRTTQP